MLVGRKLDHVNYADPDHPDDPAHSVQLNLCRDASIIIIQSFLVEIDRFGGDIGDRCYITSTFAEFCEATVRCRFTQTEFRAAVGDLCSDDYDQALLSFAYECLSGTRPLTYISSVEIPACRVVLRLVNPRSTTRGRQQECKAWRRVGWCGLGLRRNLFFSNSKVCDGKC